MGHGLNLVGEVYGYLTVLEQVPNPGLATRGKYYRCACKCGGFKIAAGTHLRTGNTTSCGCVRAEKVGPNRKRREKIKHEDVVGKRFNELTVIEFSHNSGDRGDFFRCRCVCGAEVIVRGLHIIRGLTESCGCGKKANCARAAQDRHENWAKGKVGRRYFRLVVTDVLPLEGRRERELVCLCDCGKTVNVKSGNLTSGNTKSCGCYNEEQRSLYASIPIAERFGRQKCFYRNGDIEIMMRSCFEIMYAEILDLKGIKWIYEPRVFVLKPYMRYSPDFWVEGIGYVEVKGWMSPRAQEKIDEFRRQGNELTIIRQDYLDREHPMNYQQFRKAYLKRIQSE